MRLKNLRLLALVFSALAALLPGCASPATSSTTPATTYTLPQLTYLLLDRFPDCFWCDPDFYPVAREGQEQQNANEGFPVIQAGRDEFAAILARLGLQLKAAYTDSQKLAIYREHKKLTYVVQMTPNAGGYDFTLRTGQGQGWRYDGAITSGGAVMVDTRVASFNTCPICLAQGTLIDTPGGAVPVESLLPGMVVWTEDACGVRVAAPILRTSATPVPRNWTMVRLTLADGRTVTASPGHPSAAGRALGEYQAGEELDGSRVTATERLLYTARFTCDILPGGATRCYWANGILLGSTLG
jgi:hypothetical protein